MLHRRRPLVVVAFLLALLAISVGPARLFAQSATPMASPATQPITVEVLGKGMPSNAPGLSLELDRVTLQPGATIPTHIHPGAYVITVVSGQFGFTLIKGEAQWTKAGSTTPQAIQPGTEVVAQAGDALFENGGVVHAARAVGDQPAVVLTASLLDPKQPSLMPSNAMGTPTM